MERSLFFLQNINYNVQNLHTCASWKWRAHILFYFIFFQLLQNIITIPKKSHTCPSWKWKVHVSFHSSNTLQCPKFAYMYILEWKVCVSFHSSSLLQCQKSKTFVHPGSGKQTFPDNILITIPQNQIHASTSWQWKIKFLSIPPIHYNAQKLHTCPSWKWKGHVSFHSSNILQWPKITYMYFLEMEN